MCRSCGDAAHSSSHGDMWGGLATNSSPFLAAALGILLLPDSVYELRVCSDSCVKLRFLCMMRLLHAH